MEVKILPQVLARTPRKKKVQASTMPHKGHYSPLIEVINFNSRGLSTATKELNSFLSNNTLSMNTVHLIKKIPKIKKDIELKKDEIEKYKHLIKILDNHHPKNDQDILYKKKKLKNIMKI